MKQLVLIFVLASSGLVARADGTIAFANTTFTRCLWYQSPGSTVPVPTTTRLNYGVFWGTNQNSLALALPLGTSSTTSAGIIVAPSLYSIPGTEAGQTVYMKIVAWSASFGMDWEQARWAGGYGETVIRQITLAPEAGPATLIWQSATGTNPNRFHPLLCNTPLTPPAEVFLGYPPNNLLTIDEGNSGVVDVPVTVFRRSWTGPSATTLNYSSSVLLSTISMTAQAGHDFVATNVMVTFGPGETSRVVNIKVTGDPLPESDEQFGVNLTGGISFVVVSPEVFLLNVRGARVDSVRREGANLVALLRTTRFQRYALESSENLVSWLVVPGAENITGTGGIVEIPDPLPAVFDYRFYRTRLVP